MYNPFKKSQLPSAAQSILPLGNHLIHPDWCLLLLFAGDDSALCLLSLCDNTTQNGDDIDLHYSDLDDEVIESSLLDNSNPGNQIPLYDAQISPQTSPSATYRTTTTNPIEQAHLQIPLTRRAPLPTSTNEGDDPLRSRKQWPGMRERQSLGQC